MSNDNPREQPTPPGSEELFRLMVESVKDYAIFATDAEGRIVSWNSGAERTFGYMEEEAVGQSAAIIFTPEDIEKGAPEKELRKAAKEGRAEDERWHMRRDGTRFWASGMVTPLTDDEENLRGFVKVARDITERKRAEALLLEREEQFRTLADSIPQLAWMADAEGYIFWYNRRWYEYTGTTLEEMRGWGWQKVHHPDEVERVTERFKRAVAAGEPWEDTFPLRSKQGEYRRFLSRALPIRDAEGRVARWFGTNTDVEEQSWAEEERLRLLEDERRAREEAVAAQRRTAFLAESGTVLSSSLDYQTTVAGVARMVVPGLADWCAVDLLDEGGRARRLAVAHADPSKVEWAEELQRRYPTDPDAPYGVPHVLRTGESELYPEIPDELLAQAAKDDEHLRIMREIGFTSAMIVPLVARGRTLGAVSLISTESGRRYGPEDLAFAEELARRCALAIDNARLYGEAQSARAAAEQANRIKDEFLATLSHELRTPLTAILGWSRMLTTTQLDAENTARALESIERNARAQVRLTDDILDVSRIITGKLRLEVRPVDLAPVIEGAIESIRPAAEAKSIRLQRVLDTGPQVVSGDPERLQQVVWNLLSNAVKFTPKGGRVQVRLERVNSHVEVTVSDTGRGISPEVLPHVFERFLQADSSTTREHGGLGLGLAIVRHLVELHGGTVRAESEGEGQGATFTVDLPLMIVRAPRAKASRDVERAHPTADVGEGLVCPPELEGLHVLFVDDEEDARALLTTVLESCGARVTAVGSARAALDELKREKFDVLLSDIGMPGEDGYWLIKRVRKLPLKQGGQTPAAALTAYAGAKDRLRALRSGYQTHVPKPVEPAELVTVVANLAGRHEKD